MAHMQYKSPFQNWNKDASVRSQPERRLLEEQEDGKLFFSRSLSPFAQHPLCNRDAGMVKAMMVRQLYAYMSFTEQLEHEIVNDVTYKISTNNIGVTLPQAMRRDARNIYVDESYHAKFSADMVDDVEKVSGIKQHDLPRPKFLQLLDVLGSSFTPAEAMAARACLATVSETLITANLLRIPRDNTVTTVVRALVNDHAADESRHHAYFRSFFPEFWKQLPAYLQLKLGTMLPHYVKGFVAPDLAMVGAILGQVGLSETEVEWVIADSYTHADMHDMAAAKATLQLFAQVGIFESPPLVDAFQAAGIQTP